MNPKRPHHYPMRIKRYRYSLLFYLLLSQLSYAVSFLSFDPRTMAMGGTGVATAKSYNATLFNPALLVVKQESE